MHTPDMFMVMAALKQIKLEITALREMIDELRDDVKTIERGGNEFQLVLRDARGTESDEDSVQSAP